MNLLIGTDGGMMLLDRSGQGKGFTFALNLPLLPDWFCCSVISVLLPLSRYDYEYESGVM